MWPIVESTKFYTALDWFKVTGRGDVAVVTLDARCAPEIGEVVVIDGFSYKVSGIERHCIVDWNRPGEKVGLLVGKRLTVDDLPKRYVRYDFDPENPHILWVDVTYNLSRNPPFSPEASQEVAAMGQLLSYDLTKPEDVEAACADEDNMLSRQWIRDAAARYQT